MATYKNPFSLTDQWDGNQLGDPFIMRYDGMYYLYCSSHRMEIKCWTSENLVDWTYAGSVCNLPEIDGAYAPEVAYIKGKFYMVTSPKGSGHYLLVSDSPTGPFELATENFGLLIDGSLYQDDDGSVYFLRAGHQGIEIHDVELPNAPVAAGTRIPQSHMNHWTEGPMIIKRDGLYFLTFCGNHLLSRGYRIDYAVSAEGVKGEYITPRRPTLLLEVGDEFHALGHSSTVLGPDMDSYFIAYHSFDFIAQPRYRSLNIDRLFFDGGRMYTNACWWQQQAPAMPAFMSRGGEGLQKQEVDGKTYLFTPPAGVEFTAELNINPKGKAAYVKAGDIDVELEPTDYNQTVRIAQGKRYLLVWIDGMLVYEDISENTPCEGIGIYSEAGELPGFVGFSHVAEGSADAKVPHNVPGRFLAVHGDIGETEDHIENGLPAKSAVINGKLTYRLNVKEAGEYQVFLRVMSTTDEDIVTIVNGRPLMSSPVVGEMQMMQAARVNLEAGENTLVIEGQNIRLLDEITIIPFAQVPSSLALVKDGRLACDANVLGHKRQESMLGKTWGYTCAENNGYAFIGKDGWVNYGVDATINIDRNTNGSASILLRATKESWYPDQAMPPFWGYEVRVDANGICLLRCDYGEKELACLTFNNTVRDTVRVTIDVIGNYIEIKHGENRLEYFDPDAHHYGKVGLQAKWEGFGFEKVDLTEANLNV